MTDEQNVQHDSNRDMSEENQAFLRELEAFRDADPEEVHHSPQAMGMTFERQRSVQRQLLSHVVENLNDTIAHTASDAMSELLGYAHEEMAEELLEPIFEWSDYWAQRIAAEILELPTDEEYTHEELLSRFEQRERAEAEDQNQKVNWMDEGF